MLPETRARGGILIAVMIANLQDIFAFESVGLLLFAADGGDWEGEGAVVTLLIVVMLVMTRKMRMTMTRTMLTMVP